MTWVFKSQDTGVIFSIRLKSQDTGVIFSVIIQYGTGSLGYIYLFFCLLWFLISNTLTWHHYILFCSLRIIQTTCRKMDTKENLDSSTSGWQTEVEALTFLMTSGCSKIVIMYFVNAKLFIVLMKNDLVQLMEMIPKPWQFELILYT